MVGERDESGASLRPVMASPSDGREGQEATVALNEVIEPNRRSEGRAEKRERALSGREAGTF